MSNSAAGRPPRGLLFVVSAPSGTGKTTLVERLVVQVPDLTKSRSYTSRGRRADERDGVDYNFISRAAFEAMVREKAFLEWADVFGHLYGTGRQETEARLASGADLVLVIDVQGARQVRSFRRSRPPAPRSRSAIASPATPASPGALAEPWCGVVPAM